jgi:metal-dependent amidase/aminoacylase/carboxypeptidase family protein
VNVQGLDPELAGRLGGLYQQSHRDPELSLQERQTAARVTAALPSTGVEVTAGVGGTGVGDQEPRFDWNLSAPVLVSDPAATAITVAAFERQFGTERSVPLPPLSASEDVGTFGEAAGVPTVYWLWGGVEPKVFWDAISKGRMPPVNHSPQFAPVLEPTLTTGMQAMTAAALCWLETA